MMMSNRVTLTCKGCEVDFNVPYKSRNSRRYCSRECYLLNCGGKNNPAYNKTYRTKITHPEWAAKIRKSTKGINRGDKNGMKNPTTRAKMSKTRREKVTSDPQYRKMLSEHMTKAWKNGKYDHVNVGKCKWYSYTKKDGSTCKLQGTWELKYAKWLDEHDVQFIAHRGRISYVLNGNDRAYYPDFYLVNDNLYVDVKMNITCHLIQKSGMQSKNQIQTFE